MRFIVALALVATTANAARCDGTATSGILPIVAPASDCQVATGYAILPPTTHPTTDDVKAICSKCKDFVAVAKVTTFPTCTFRLSGQEVPYDKLIRLLTDQCGSTNPVTPPPPTTPVTPVVTTATPAPTTATPAPTTAAPVATTDAPVATTDAPVTTTDAPVATTDAPVATSAATTTAPPNEESSAAGSTGTTNGAAVETTKPAETKPTVTASGATKSGDISITISIVGGIVVVVASIIVFFLWRRGCACFGRRQQEPMERRRPEVGDNGDSVYVDMWTHDKSTQNQRTAPVDGDAVGVYSHKTDSRAKQTIVDEEYEFPGQLLAVRIPFENLQIGDVISRGGFGEVLLATYRNRDVAVKRLLGTRWRDPKSVSSFVQEIKLNATLNHPCLVRFIGAAWDVRENLCMVSEYVSGGDLRTLLSEYAVKGYPNGHDGSKLRTAIQIAQALTYLHSSDPPVVHRDLKSRNVLLTEVLDAKLIDLGVSTECIDETMTAGVGTSLWMAPEVMMGKRYDVKADVFSFGVILSELDTHEIPYDHVRDPESERKLASALLNRLIYEGRVKPRFTQMADPEIVLLARDCLEVDPSKRPTSAQVLARISRGGRQGGRSKERGGPQSSGTGTQSSGTATQSSRSDTRNSLMFDTRATTQSGRAA